MKKRRKQILATLLAMGVATASVPSVVAYADAVPIVTLGADLTEEQKSTIYEFFGVSDTAVDVIEITNAQERQYLEGLIPDEVIGTRTLSCSYIMPTTAGGIVVKTANLNWVSEGMLANALLTSGIENCQVLATAPFEVSGTGALTGVMTAYEQSSGEELSEDKKQLATEELVLTGDLVDEVVNSGYTASIEQTTNADGEPVTGTTDASLNNAVSNITEEQLLALLNDIKAEVINGNLSKEKVKEILDKHLQEYKLQVSDELYDRLVEYLTSLSGLSYSDKIKSNLSDLTDRIKDGFDININVNIDFKTDKGSLEQFWANVLNFLKYLFGGVSDEIKEQAGSIFDSINTGIIQYDTPTEGTDNGSSTPDNADSNADSGVNVDSTESVDSADGTSEVSAIDDTASNAEESANVESNEVSVADTANNEEPIINNEDTAPDAETDVSVAEENEGVSEEEQANA